MQEMTHQDLRCREISIQIGLNGFSFVVFDLDPTGFGGEAIVRSVAYRDTDMASILVSEPMLTAVDPPMGRVFVGCATDNVLLVPQLLFEPERAEQYLTAANMYVPEMTTLSNNLLSAQAAAVWQVDAGLAAGLLQLYPGALFYHPLLLELDATPTGCVQAILDGELVHLTVCHDRLYAAETLRVDTPEELLYYIQKLVKRDGFTSYRLMLTGEGAGRFRSFFEPYFSDVEVRDVRFYNHQRIREICG
ncbi:MAG: DUF3822 family protein [Rikenella sp.]|nr:DUF3822 family protein [Rikenella sp.]